MQTTNGIVDSTILIFVHFVCSNGRSEDEGGDISAKTPRFVISVRMLDRVRYRRKISKI